MICLFNMNDEEMKNWQRGEITKSRIDNLLNQVIETYRTFQDSYNNSTVNQNQEQSNQNPQNSYHLEESAIAMAINAHGLQRSSSNSENESSNNSIISNTDIDNIRNISSYNLDESDAITMAINAHGLQTSLTEQSQCNTRNFNFD